MHRYVPTDLFSSFCLLILLRRFVAQNARHEAIDVDNVLDAVARQKDRQAPADIEKAAAAAAAVRGLRK